MTTLTYTSLNSQLGRLSIALKGSGRTKKLETSLLLKVTSLNTYAKTTHERSANVVVGETHEIW